MHYIFKNKESYNKINNKYGTKLENSNRKIGKKFSILNPKRYFRYVKLFLNSKVLITIMLFAVIANLVINFQNKNYENTYKDNEKVKMTDKETDLLMILIKNRGKPWKIEELYENVWNEKFFPSSSNTIMVHILRLRQKIENNPAQPAIIRTIYGKGYQID